MIELPDHSPQRLTIDPLPRRRNGQPSERGDFAAVIEHVLGFRFPSNMWRNEGWALEFEVSPGLRAEVESVLRARQWLHRDGRLRRRFRGRAAAISELRKQLGGLVRHYRAYVEGLPANWFADFHFRDGSYALVDTSGGVLLGWEQASGKIWTRRVRRWADASMTLHELSAEQRRARAVRALEKGIYLGELMEQTHKREFPCPESGAVAVSPREWPSHFPANCPPASVPAASGTVYRLVNDDDNDFVSALEAGLFKNHPPCQRASLSCFRTLRQARNQLRLVKRFRYVASGELVPEYGKLARTGPRPGHHSLWLRAASLSRAKEIFVTLR